MGKLWKGASMTGYLELCKIPGGVFIDVNSKKKQKGQGIEVQESNEVVLLRWLSVAMIYLIAVQNLLVVAEKRCFVGKFVDSRLVKRWIQM
ncbi:hypothetical protein V6N11_055307 [Hibiscus sabdariffa]|uniref:Uncharacterized protein n=1 Tax=Hibiscus sabdariffa TaxID=183260 RepID=A0ABR2PEW9_9ROSI